MIHQSDAATHLRNITFELNYPASPFYPTTPVIARFSGVLTADGQLHVRLDAGSIPETPSSAGIPIQGSFSAGPDEPRMGFSGLLSNNRIDAVVA